MGQTALIRLLPLVGAMMTSRPDPRGVLCGELLPLVGAMMTLITGNGALTWYVLLPLVGAMMTPLSSAAVSLA